MKILLTALLLASTAASAHVEAWQRKYLLASRNSGGAYSLPNAPVVTGTTISSTWANSTLTDLATEITNSLDRSGRGAMTGPLRLTNGASAAVPDLAWGVETNTGFFRAGAGDIRSVLGGVPFQQWTANASNFLVTGTAASVPFQILQGSLADGNTITTTVGIQALAGQEALLTYTKNVTALNSTYCLGIFGGSTSTLCVDGNNIATTNGALKVNGSFNNNGSAFKHVRVTGCSTAAGVGSQCTVTITWATAFADVNYTAVCTPTLIAGTPTTAFGTKAAATLQVLVDNAAAPAAQVSSFDCIAVHD